MSMQSVVAMMRVLREMRILPAEFSRQEARDSFVVEFVVDGGIDRRVSERGCFPQPSHGYRACRRVPSRNAILRS